MKTKDFSKIYLSILLLHLVVIYKPDSIELYYLSKPLLLFSLAVFFINRNGFTTISIKQVAAALALSLAGDVLLMRDGEFFFLGGMAAFLLAHLFYLLFYFGQRLKASITPILGGVAVAGAGLWTLYTYVNTPPELELYLYVYGIVLGLHFVISLLFAYANKGLQWLSALGAFLFLISDLILAFNKFNESTVYLSIAVMLTYGLAQYCIVLSINDYLKKGRGD